MHRSGPDILKVSGWKHVPSGSRTIRRLSFRSRRYALRQRRARAYFGTRTFAGTVWNCDATDIPFRKSCVSFRPYVDSEPWGMKYSYPVGTCSATHFLYSTFGSAYSTLNTRIGTLTLISLYSGSVPASPLIVDRPAPCLAGTSLSAHTLGTLKTRVEGM